MRRPFSSLLFPLRAAALGAAAGLTSAALAAAGLGWWIDYFEPPRKADLLVVLGGRYSRPLYAADLYKQGLAPEIWLARIYRPPADLKVVSLGVDLPAEEEVDREILLKSGVPASAIRLYGTRVMSTANEALALSRAVETRGKTVLVLTSRYHARRAKWIFRSALKGADIVVSATPYEEFTRRWWTRQALARNAILEGAKTLFYLLGGRFFSQLEDTPLET